MREDSDYHHKLVNSEHYAYIDPDLKAVLDSCIYNLQKDWHFVMLVSGDDMVRVGKSVMALNIGAYVCSKLNKEFTIDNIYYDPNKMVEDASFIEEKNRIFVLDEAGLTATRRNRFKKEQGMILDFFEQAGQLNHIYILVLPSFFDLNKDLAVSHSTGLINVYRMAKPTMKKDKETGEDLAITQYQRGYYGFYNQKEKKMLYSMGRKIAVPSYNMVTPSLHGRFPNNYPIEENLYRNFKKQAFLNFLEEKENKMNNRVFKRDLAIYEMYKLMGPDEKEIVANNIGLKKIQLSSIVSQIKKKIIYQNEQNQKIENMKKIS